MKEKTIKLVVGALLHDIGKVLYRYDDGKNHSISGAEYLEYEIHIQDKDILEQVKYHHAGLLKEAEIEKNSLAYLTYIADNIAFAADRRNNETEESGFDKEAVLQSIFNLLNENDQKYVCKPQQLSSEINYPLEQARKFDESSYQNMVLHLKENLTEMDYNAAYLDSLLTVLETEWSYVPCSAAQSEVADISLYDHVKLTAALANCIAEWLEEHGIEDYKEELFQKAENFYQKQVFLLYSMDVSGIQDFIYTIASKDALKSLRSRSFYLELVMEDLIDELVAKLEVTRANLLYSGGGHAYLLLPNTKKAKEQLEVFEQEVNEWLLEQFHTKLFLGCGYQECSAAELQNKPEGSYRAIFRQVSSKISQKKMHRYTAKQLIKLNYGEIKAHTRECRVCRTTDELTDEGICRTCDALIKMSSSILHKGFYAVTKRSDIVPSLPLSYGKYLIAQSEKALLEKIKKEEILRIYTKNEAYTGSNVTKRLWVGDYTNGETFEELEKRAEGIKRIAVFRADVDNLGTAFVNGFSSKKYGEKYMTISRTATFSRKMSMFFKYHINSILENGNYYITDKKKVGKRDITIVYSGGDDVFIVGSWDEVIGFAVDLRESFKKFTQDTLSLSAGIGIYAGKYPISAMARETGELEDAAKSYPQKNAVALFTPELTFSWDELIDNVLEEKLHFIKQFFEKVPEKGKTFLYRLLELIRFMEEDNINLARLAYLMGRLEEDIKKKTKKEMHKEVQKLSKQIYLWAKDKNERKSLTAAIYLYAYLIRE